MALFMIFTFRVHKSKSSQTCQDAGEQSKWTDFWQLDFLVEGVSLGAIAEVSQFEQIG